MLKEPLIVCTPASGYPSQYSSYINAPTDGRSSRTFPPLADSIITVNQGVSNENGKDVQTTRSNVRVAQAQALGSTGTSVKAYAQLTLSYPKAVFTAAEMQDLVAALFHFVTFSDGLTTLESELPTSIAPSSGLLLIPRLYAGEA